MLVHVLWVDVKKRLPPESGDYLCSFDDGTIETFNLSEDELHLCKTDLCNKWGCFVAGGIYTAVEYWAEVPKPPGRQELKCFVGRIDMDERVVPRSVIFDDFSEAESFRDLFNKKDAELFVFSKVDT